MPTDFFEWKTLLPRLIAAGAVLAVFLLRTPLARALLRILLPRLHRRDIERYRQIRDTLCRPLALLLTAGTARAVFPLAGIPGKYGTTAANLLSTLFLIAAFRALYVAAGLSAALLASPGREKRKKLDANAANYIAVAGKAAVAVIGVLAVLSRWVSDVSGLIAGLGIGGLAIALAAQDTASNLFGSIAILLDKPFEIGDWIEVEGHAGTVIRVGLRSTQIRVVDQSILSVPNSKLASSIVSNGTKRITRRVAFRIGLVYATPPGVVDAFVDGVRALLRGDAEIDADSVLVSFDTFAASALEVFIAYQTVSDYTDMMAVRQRNNLAVLDLANRMGVALAYPSVSIYPGTPHIADAAPLGEERHAD
ncbi:MAG: mechanosensitive ion channel [Clostridia bacterium]|nr:mechanosensitive ion channel [Clostridia bacterium]